LSSLGGGGTVGDGAGLSLVLLQTRVYFSILYIIHPPPAGTPSKGRQQSQTTCPPLGEMARSDGGGLSLILLQNIIYLLRINKSID